MSNYNAINKTGRSVRPGEVIDGKGLVSLTMKFSGLWVVTSTSVSNKNRSVGVRPFKPGQGWSVVYSGSGIIIMTYREGEHVVVNSTTAAAGRVKKDPALLRFMVGGMCARMAVAKAGGEVIEGYNGHFVINTQYVHMGVSS